MVRFRKAGSLVQGKTDTVAEQGGRAVAQIYKCRAQETFCQWVRSRMPPPETTAYSEASKDWVEQRLKHLQLLSCSIWWKPHGYTHVTHAASTEGHLHTVRVHQSSLVLLLPSHYFWITFYEYGSTYPHICAPYVYIYECTHMHIRVSCGWGIRRGPKAAFKSLRIAKTGSHLSSHAGAGNPTQIFFRSRWCP